jgi:adenine-specific DNA-methyltransferase
MLIPNKNYILLRRFSSKDDKSRLIAAPYFCNFIKSEYIGVENKVNYIYRPKGHLDRNEIFGLCALLNSPLFDSFFRIFNGNVNVSATELREIPLPELEAIKEIGNEIILSNDFSVENTNKIVIEQFELSKSLYE